MSRHFMQCLLSLVLMLTVFAALSGQEPTVLAERVAAMERIADLALIPPSASLLPLPKQQVPSRGWGEDFWVRVTERDGQFLKASVDNPLVESRLHALRQGDEILFQEDHILAVHSIHRPELILGMNAADLEELARWLASQR